MQNNTNALHTKPSSALAYNFDNIPEEFKQHKNWLLWKYEQHKGKLTKVPYQANNSKGNATSAATWVTFDKAAKAYNSGDFSGIGFAIGDSGLTCVDIDHTQSFQQSELNDILNGLNNKFYKETSPSGDGYHLWLKAVKPENMGCKSDSFHNSCVEIYDSKRYITMTGSAPSGAIEECQEEFEKVFSPLIKKDKPTSFSSAPLYPSTLSDDDLLLKISNSSDKGQAGSHKFMKLHYGTFISDDMSSDDMSYINTLAFWTGKDTIQMDRIYRQSAIARPKWDELRGDRTYGQITLDKALESVTETYKGNSDIVVADLFDDISKHVPDNDPFNVKSVNLKKPPGLAGEICLELNDMAYRPLPLSYPLTALHILNEVSCHTRGVGGMKINLITLLIAQSASGKDLGSKALSQLAASIKRVKPMIGKPRSDVDLITNMIESAGKCSYEIDEAHSLFDSVNSKNAQTYQASMSAEILSMATTSLYGISGNHQRALLPRYIKELALLEKKYETEKDKNAFFNDQKLDAKIDNINKIIEMIEEGVPNPTINMSMYSTPEKIDSIGDASAIESGLMGRALLWRVSDEREHSVLEPKINHLSKELLNKLSDVTAKDIKLTDDAKLMLERMFYYYEQNEYRNHNTKGALYSRLIERVKTIASLLAVETGYITTEILTYALAATLRHIDDVEFLRRKSVSHESHDALGDHIIDLILSKVVPIGVAQSTVKNAVLNCSKQAKESEKQAKRGNTKSIYDAALEHLLKNGSVTLSKSKLHKK